MKPAGVPTGTSISVADIFYCVPARRKFLKSETTELGHIASLVTHYALAHPEVHFLLKTPSQEILNCRAGGKAFRARLSGFRPPGARRADGNSAERSARALRDHRACSWSRTSRRRRLRVSGFTSRPEVQRTNRNGIYIFVNRRLVRDRLLLHAICEAYRNIMPPGVFPVRAAVPRSAVPGSGRERAPGENRGALPASAVRSRFHARRAAPRAFARAPDSGISRRARCRSSCRQCRCCWSAGRCRRCRRRIRRRLRRPRPARCPGPPRAEIPMGFASGAAVAEAFELTVAPDRPIPQRLGFDLGRRDRIFRCPGRCGRELRPRQSTAAPVAGVRARCRAPKKLRT